MKSYLLSTLVVQAATLEQDAFFLKHPYDWLLWEPGVWKPPKGATISAGTRHLSPNTTGEALVIGLERKGAPDAPVELDTGPRLRLRAVA